MAYHDENGKLTIDEVAANKDIKRLREAADILKNSRASIRSLRQQSADMKGLSARAIQEKSDEMERKLSQMIEQLEYTATYIQATVKRYQQIDADLKKLIQQTTQAVQDVVKPPVVGGPPKINGIVNINSIGAAAKQGLDTIFKK